MAERPPHRPTYYDVEYCGFLQELKIKIRLRIPDNTRYNSTSPILIDTRYLGGDLRLRTTTRHNPETNRVEAYTEVLAAPLESLVFSIRYWIWPVQNLANVHPHYFAYVKKLNTKSDTTSFCRDELIVDHLAIGLLYPPCDRESGYNRPPQFPTVEKRHIEFCAIIFIRPRRTINISLKDYRVPSINDVDTNHTLIIGNRRVRVHKNIVGQYVRDIVRDSRSGSEETTIHTTDMETLTDLLRFIYGYPTCQRRLESPALRDAAKEFGVKTLHNMCQSAILVEEARIAADPAMRKSINDFRRTLEGFEWRDYVHPYMNLTEPVVQNSTSSPTIIRPSDRYFEPDVPIRHQPSPSRRIETRFRVDQVEDLPPMPRKRSSPVVTKRPTSYRRPPGFGSAGGSHSTPSLDGERPSTPMIVMTPQIRSQDKVVLEGTTPRRYSPCSTDRDGNPIQPSDDPAKNDPFYEYGMEESPSSSLSPTRRRTTTIREDPLSIKDNRAVREYNSDPYHEFDSGERSSSSSTRYRKTTTCSDEETDKELMDAIAAMEVSTEDLFDEESPDELSPDEASSDELSPNEVSPDDALPDELSPDEASPNELSPDEASPNELSPDETSPNELSPDEASPNEVSPDHQASEAHVSEYADLKKYPWIWPTPANAPSDEISPESELNYLNYMAWFTPLSSYNQVDAEHAEDVEFPNYLERYVRLGSDNQLGDAERGVVMQLLDDESNSRNLQRQFGSVSTSTETHPEPSHPDPSHPEQSHPEPSHPEPSHSETSHPGNLQESSESSGCDTIGRQATESVDVEISKNPPQSTSSDIGQGVKRKNPNRKSNRFRYDQSAQNMPLRIIEPHQLESLIFLNLQRSLAWSDSPIYRETTEYDDNVVCGGPSQSSAADLSDLPALDPPEPICRELGQGVKKKNRNRKSKPLRHQNPQHDPMQPNPSGGTTSPSPPPLLNPSEMIANIVDSLSLLSLSSDDSPEPNETEQHSNVWEQD